MIYQRIDCSDFCRAFDERGRGDQFSTDALRLIFDHLEEQETDQELDVIAICCDFGESSIEELAIEQDVDPDDVRDHMDQSTLVLGETDAETLVYLQF
jgi:hypothetical protein